MMRTLLMVAKGYGRFWLRVSGSSGLLGYEMKQPLAWVGDAGCPSTHGRPTEGQPWAIRKEPLPRWDWLICHWLSVTAGINSGTLERNKFRVPVALRLVFDANLVE